MRSSFLRLILAVFIAGRLAALPSPVQSGEGLSLSLEFAPGEDDLFERAEIFCWLSDPDQPLRAVIIHQHGCTSAKPDQHPPVTLDFHWRALARKHDCALVVPFYEVEGACSNWNDPDSGSERALFAALADFAARTGREELPDLPWVMWGHSGGSSWSSQMILRHPGRVLAASFRGGCHKQFGDPGFREVFGPFARDLPLLFVWGKRETDPASRHHVSWGPMNTMFGELRLRGGRAARVIDPASEHGCDNSRLLVIPFFDAVLAAKGNAEELPGALVELESFEDREQNETSLRDPSLAWLPNDTLARQWREFSESGTLSPKNPALSAPFLEAVADEGGQVLLRWWVEPALDGGLRAVRLYRDGERWKEFGVAPDASVATSRDSPPEELRFSSFVDDTVEPGESPVYGLTFLDAAGNESPPGLARIRE